MLCAIFGNNSINNKFKQDEGYDAYRNPSNGNA